MRTTKNAIIILIVFGLVGCGDPPNRSVTDGVDVEAIRAYEEIAKAGAKEEASIDYRAQAIAEAKEAAEILKKEQEEAKNAAP
jgi:hypothetical protein